MKPSAIARFTTGGSLASMVLASLVEADMTFMNRTIDDQLGDEATGRLVSAISFHDTSENSPIGDLHILSLYQ